MAKSKRKTTPTDRRRQAAARTSTKQIAKNAVRGGPKNMKRQARPDAGRGQKG